MSTEAYLLLGILVILFARYWGELLGFILFLLLAGGCAAAVWGAARLVASIVV